MLKRVQDYWLISGLFFLLYFFGLSFWSFLWFFFLFFRFFKKRPWLWWFVFILFSLNILVFRTLIFLALFSLLFYFFSKERKNWQPEGGNLLFSHWPLILTFFILIFDLFSFSTSYRFSLGFCWFIFFALALYFSRCFVKDAFLVLNLIFSFVFSQLFFILYFLPFGNVANSGFSLVFLLALTDYRRNHSLKRFLGLAVFSILLLFFSGIKPR